LTDSERLCEALAALTAPFQHSLETPTLSTSSLCSSSSSDFRDLTVRSLALMRLWEQSDDASFSTDYLARRLSVAHDAKNVFLSSSPLLVVGFSLVHSSASKCSPLPFALQALHRLLIPVMIPALPAELLAHILDLAISPVETISAFRDDHKLLYRCCLVSKQLCNEAQRRLWRVFHSDKDDLSPLFVSTALARQVTVLDLRSGTSLKSGTLPLAGRLPQLKELRLEKCEFRLEDLVAFDSACSALLPSFIQDCAHIHHLSSDRATPSLPCDLRPMFFRRIHLFFHPPCRSDSARWDRRSVLVRLRHLPVTPHTLQHNRTCGPI
jgi:hypothetical protein